MLSLGRMVTILIGVAYFSTFYAVAAFGHTKSDHQSAHQPCAVADDKSLEQLPGQQRLAQIRDKLAQNISVIGDLESLAWVYVDLARSESDDRFYRTAEQTAHCILSIEPESLSAKLILGHVRHQQHRFKDAEVLARELVNKRGYWFDHALLGDVLAEQGLVNQAVPAYEAMISQRPGPQAYSRIAHIRWLTGDLAGAISAMKIAIASSAGAREHRAWFHVRLAEFLFYDGQLSAAEQATNIALQIKPKYPLALARKGRILLEDGRTMEAVKYLSTAVAGSALPTTQWWLLEALDASALSAQRGTLEQQLIQNHEDPRTIALYLADKRLDVSRALYLAEQELRNRRDALTLDAMAWALHSAGRNQEALGFIREAGKQGLRDARLFLHGAVIERVAGDGAIAKNLLAKAAASSYTLLPSEQKHLQQEIALPSS